jgi:hypothetical protein
MPSSPRQLVLGPVLSEAPNRHTRQSNIEIGVRPPHLPYQQEVAHLLMPMSVHLFLRRSHRNRIH